MVIYSKVLQIYLDEKPYYNIDFYEDSYDDTQNILIMTIIKNNINMLIGIFYIIWMSPIKEIKEMVLKNLIKMKINFLILIINQIKIMHIIIK